MRMNSLQRSRGQGRKRLAIVLVAAVLMGLVYLVPEPFGAFSSMVLKPVHSVRLWWRDSGHVFPAYFRDRSAMRHEIDDLKARLYEAELKDTQSGITTDPQLDGRIGAQILRVPGETPYDTLVLASGSEEGIKEGALVYAEGAAIGTVAKVYPRTSIVVLYSTPGMHVPVYLWGASVFARAEGMGGGVLRIGIPQGLPVAPGDAVTIPVPGSAVYGKVDHIESDATNPEQYVYVTGQQALRSLRLVTVDRDVLPTVSREEAERAIVDVKAGIQPSPLAPLLEEIPVGATTTIATTTS